MTRTRRLWVPVLAGLLAAGLLGVGSGGAVAVEPRTVTESIMVSAATFTPSGDNWDYDNNGSYLILRTGPGAFSAPLSLPVAAVNIKRITLYAQRGVCVHLFRSRPAAATFDHAGMVCTADSTAASQTVHTTEISPRQVNTEFHSPYLWVYLSEPNVYFYGVKITYTYETGA
jgi:hypothetical protein